MERSVHQQMVFEANRKSVGVAYLLWFFLGFFGVHRFYAGKTGTGITQLVLALSIIGWLVLVPWLLVDLILIPGMIGEKNLETINTLTFGDPEGARDALHKPQTVADKRRQQMLDDLRSTGYRKDRRLDLDTYR